MKVWSVVVLFVLGLLGWGMGCTGDVGDCDVDPVADCFRGKITGCSEDNPCPQDDCSASSCEEGTCVQTPHAAGTICSADGESGACDGAGECWSCEDGVQNGAEQGIDCGPGLCGGECNGAVCPPGGAGECKSGECADGVCCDVECTGLCMSCVATAGMDGATTGACAPVPVGEMGPDDGDCADGGGCGAAPGWCRCEDGVRNGDETDVDCGGSCGSTCTIGQACASEDDCDSKFKCVDGVCCENSCGGTCNACNQMAHPGACSPFSGKDEPDCAAPQECNASGQCVSSSSTCSSDNNCASGLCHAPTCIYCARAEDCKSQICIDGYCASAAANGAACTGDDGCSSAHCVDGICCDEACEEGCMGCHTAYTGLDSGICGNITLGYDPHDACDGPGAAATCDGHGACGVNLQ